MQLFIIMAFFERPVNEAVTNISVEKNIEKEEESCTDVRSKLCYQ